MRDRLYNLLGSDGATTREGVKRAVRAVVAQAQQSRLAPPKIEIEPVQSAIEIEQTPAFEVEAPEEIDEVLGVAAAEIEGRPTAFTPATSRDLPILQRLYQKFRAALPGPRLVRVDGEDSYAAFREKRREPHLAALTERVLRLEQLLADHVADQHGGGRLARLEGAFRTHVAEGHGDQAVIGAYTDLERSAEVARRGGQPIPLSLEPGSEGKIEGWQDGEELLCSIRLLGPDGRVRVATTGSGIARPIDDVIAYANDAGVDPVEIVGVLPVLAQMLGCGALLTQLCSATPAIMAQPEVIRGDVFVGRMVPKSDPALSATVALLQHCQRGDARACAEADRMRHGRGAALLTEAEKRLAHALKHRRVI